MSRGRLAGPQFQYSTIPLFRFPRFGRAFLGLSLIGCLVLALALPAHAIVDLNGNGMSDIWEIIFGASALSPTADTDGDGASNLAESVAATDPFNANSVAKISSCKISGTNFNVTIPCALGKQYQLLSIAAPGVGTNWTVEASTIVRSGTSLTLVGAAPGSGAGKLFKIAIADVDSDGDGVSDWEEYQLGLDPFNAYSNGQLDANGQPLNDYQYVVGKLAAQNQVTISASVPTATQPDPGQRATSPGTFIATRGGFPLNAITINLALTSSGSGAAVEGVDFSPLPRSIYFPVGVSSMPFTLMPLANTNRLSPGVATMQLIAGTGYTVGNGTNASVVIYPSATSTGTGLTGQYFTNSSTTYSSPLNFNPANLIKTEIDPVIDFVWGTTTTPITNNGYYCVRWTGQVRPQYSEMYYFDANTDDGVKVWVNDQLIINDWVAQGATDSIGTIALQAGVRYDIKMEYFQKTGSAVAHLYWYSPSQPKQVIPSNCLYPTNQIPAPSAVISPLYAYAFLGQPFSYTVLGANSATQFSAAPLPPGLTFSPATGVISGTPSLAGEYWITLTAGNAVGVGASVLDLLVINTGNSVVREVWTNAPGTNVADIPLSTPASFVSTLGMLQGITGYGINYGERIRGYFTAPATANYYFWIAGSDSAELWISDTAEPANIVKRAYVLPDGGGTGPGQWNVQPNQQSGWLYLTAGQQYFVQVLHKAGTGTNDNWSVAWLQDPTGTNNVPAGVVPPYLVGRYYPPTPVQLPGTLYAANLLAMPGVPTTATGSATLLVSADGSQATVKFSYNNLSSSPTARHIYNDPYLTSQTLLIYDIDQFQPRADGSYLWTIGPVGTLGTADVQELIREGKAYIEVQTTDFPAGEISGHFVLAEGSQTFTPPPAPPAWTDDHSLSNAAARFLIQASFGPTPADITNVQGRGYSGWISNQFSMPASHHLPLVLSNIYPDPTQPFQSSQTYNAWWQQSITAPDQLRQRVAFALSEITVISQNGVLLNESPELSSYYDTLLDNAFGNFRDLLRAVTLTPGMGDYLNMRGNGPGSIVTGIHANENYAREVQQLFSIGLNLLWPDGSLVMDSQGNLIPTYTQNEIMGVASVLTGWNYYQNSQTNGRLPNNWYPPYNPTNPMVLVPTQHELGTKLLLDNVMLPAAQGLAANSAYTNFDYYCSQDLEQALNSIFNHQNVGPFICRELIQRLVTSSPSRDYVYRVAQVFNDNGSGVRGDMSAVLCAILLDYEARGTNFISQPTYGKQREPLLRATAVARAFAPPAPVEAGYTQNGDRPITITVSSAPAHRLNTTDSIFLTFTDKSGQAPPSTKAFTVQTTPTASIFTVNAPGLSTGTYSQATNVTVTNTLTGGMITTNVIFANILGHGLSVGNPVYLSFTTGGALNGVYQVITSTNGNWIFVTTGDATSRSGNCLMPKFSLNGGTTSGGYSQSGTTITISTFDTHGLQATNAVYIHFKQGTAASGQYTVTSVPDPTHFTVTAAASASQTFNSLDLYPLVAPPLVRSGIVQIQYDEWNLGATDSPLDQSPLNSPTVFNFFFPGYQFPGALASAGMTTPEFQLTSDTSVANQMNFLEGGALNNSANTNGLTSFNNHGGSIYLDVGPYMNSSYVGSSGIPTLVDTLNTLLMGGQLSPGARTTIINYVTNTGNFPPSSATYMRDSVQAVVYMLIDSPDFTIQK